MKSVLILVTIIAVLAVGFALGYYFGFDIGFEKGVEEDMQANKAEVPEPGVFESDVLKVDTPLAGSKISSPVTVSGQAVGPWFFEASFPVDVTDSDGNILGQGFVQAQSEWMTTDFVPFEGEVTFGPTTDTNGFIVFRKDNPSGLPEHDDSRIMPVSFE